MAENIDLLYEKLSKRQGITVPDINTFKERYNNPEGMDLLYSKMSKMSNVNLPEKDIFKQRYLTDFSNVIGKSVTTNEPIKTNWFESTFPSLFDKKQSGVDYVFGKDDKKRQIEKPVTMVFNEPADDTESSKYKMASIQAIGKPNPSPEDLDDPYLMEVIMRNKAVIDSKFKDVKEEFKKTKNPKVLTDFKDTYITPLFNSRGVNIKEELTNSEEVKKGQLNLGKEKGGIDYLGKLYSGFKGLNPFTHPDNFNPFSEETSISKYLDKDLDLQKRNVDINESILNNLNRTTPSPLVPSTIDFYKNLSKEFGRELNKEEAISIIEGRLEESKINLEKAYERNKSGLKDIQKDLKDVISLDANFSSHLEGLQKYNSELPELTREDPKKLIAANEEDLLYKLAEYGTTNSSLSSTELLDAKLLKFKEKVTTSDVSLQDILKMDAATLNNLKSPVGSSRDEVSNFLGTLTSFQEDTWNGLNSLRDNVNANKNEEFGYPSVIKDITDKKNEYLAEAKKQNQAPDDEVLNQYNEQLLKYQGLLKDQDVLTSKLDEVEKKYFSSFKDVKQFKEGRTKLASAYMSDSLKGDFLDNLGAKATLESKPFLNTLYGMSFGVGQTLSMFGNSAASKLGIISKEQEVANTLLGYNMKNNSEILFVPEPIKNREAFSLKEDEKGNWDYDYSLSGIFSEGLTTFIQSIGLAKAGQFLGKASKLTSVMPEGMATGVGGVFASNFMLSEIDDANIELFLDGKITWNDVITKGIAEKSLEGGTEMLWTPELKMLQPLGESTVKEFSKKAFLRNALGKKLLTEDLKYLGKAIAHNFIQVPSGEVIEEIAGNLGQDVLVDPIYKNKNIQYNPEQNSTLLNNTQTAVVTALSMIPTALTGFGSSINNRRSVSKMFDYEIAKNANEFLTYGLAGIESLSEDQFSKIYPQYSNKESAKKDLQNTYKTYKDAFDQASVTTSFLVNEGQKQDYFNTVLKINSLASTSPITDVQGEELLSLAAKKKQYDVLANELKNKPLREQVASTLQENLKNLNTEDVNVPTLQASINQLTKWKQILEGDVKYKEQVDNLNEEIKKVTERIESLKPINPEVRAKETNDSGKITLDTRGGSKEIEIGKEYVLGSIISENSVGNRLYNYPTIKIIQENPDGTLQVSYDDELAISVTKESFKDFKLGTQEDIDKLPETDVRKVWDENKNNVLEFNLGNGKTAIGRLELDVDKDGKEALYFKSISQTIKDKNGERKENKKMTRKIVDNSLFVPKKGFSKGMITIKRSSEDSDAQHENKEKQLQKLQTADFSNIDRQRERRFEAINEIIKNKNEDLVKIKEIISKVEDDLLDTEIELEKFQKQISEKTNITTKTGKKSADVTKLFDKLNSLQQKNKILQENLNTLEKQKEDIEAQISHVKQYENYEFDSQTSLIEQLEEDQFDIELQLEQVNTIISNLQDIISGVKDVIKKIGEVITNLISGFEKTYGKERLTGFDSSILQDLKEIDKLFTKEYPDYSSFLEKNPEYFKNLLRFNELVNNNLDKIDLSEKEIENLKKSINANISLAKKLKDKIRHQEELIQSINRIVENKETKLKEEKAEKKKKEFLKKIYTEQDEIETSTELVQKDEAKEKEWEKTSKIDLNEIFGTTVSPSIYEEDEKGAVVLENGEPVLKSGHKDVVRLANFLNNVKDTTPYKLLVLTIHNAKNFGLSDVIFSNDFYTNTGEEVNSDIKLVIVKPNTDGSFDFVDEFGEVLPKSEVNSNSVIYSNVRTTSTLWSNKEENFSTTLKAEEKASEVLKRQNLHKEFRQELLDKSKKESNLLDIISVSAGFPIKNTSRNSVVNTIIPSSDAEVINKSVLIQVASYGSKVISAIGNTLSSKVGRPILVYGNTKVPLNNRKFTQKEINNILNIFKTFYDKGSLKGEKGNTELLTYLKKVLYFRNPKYISKNTGKSQDAEIGKNQIHYNVETNSWVIGKNEITIPNIFSSDQEGLDNLSKLEAWLSNIYQNMDVKGLLEPFIEVIDFDTNGKPVTVKWESYQAYLISDIYEYVGAESAIERPQDEIPLTTNIIPSTLDKPNVQSRHITFQEKTEKDSHEPVKIITEEPTSRPSSVDKIEDLKKRNTLEPLDNLNKIKGDGLYLLEIVASGKWYTATILGGEVVSIDLEQKEKESTVKGMLKDLINDENNPKNDSLNIFKVVPNTIKPEVKKETKVPEEVFPQQMEGELAVSQEVLDTFGISLENLPDEGEVVPEHYKLSTKEVYELENLEDAKKWLQERFSDLDFKVVNGLVDNKAWGKLADYLVILSNVAEVGTVYHEAFEVVHKYFLSDRQLKSLRKEFRNRKGEFIDHQTNKTVEYSKATDFQIKEQLAEEYREFELSKGKKKWEGEYNKNSLFRRIKAFINSILNNDIEGVFNKISNAKYKKQKPNLNLNNLIFTSKQSNYKLAKMIPGNAAYINDVLLGMTDFIFTEINKNEGNIFDIIEATNFKQIYNDLLNNYTSFYGGVASQEDAKLSKEDFIKKYSDPINNKELSARLKGSSILLNLNTWVTENKEKGKKLTTQDLLVKLHDVFRGYDFAMNNWDSLIKKHKEYLAKYSITFEDVEDVEEENGKSRNDIGRDVAKISAKRTANSEIKLLIASLKEVRDRKVIDGKTVIYYKVNSMLTHVPVDYGKTLINLLYKFSNSVTFEDMTKVVDNEIKNGNFSLENLKVKLKMGNKSPLKEEKDIKLRTSFMQSLNKMQIDYFRTILNEDLTSTIFNPNEKKALSIKTSEFFNALKDEKNPFNLIENGRLKINPEYLKTPSKDESLKSAVDWLRSIGVQFDVKLELLPGEGDKNTRADLQNGIQKLRAALKKLSAEEIFTENNNEVRQALEQIAGIYNAYTVNYAEPQHNNINGDPVQNIVLHNYIGRLFKKLNKATSLKNLYESIKQYNPQNVGNGYLSFVQSLREDVRGNFKKLDLHYNATEGIQERNEEGVSGEKQSPADRFITQMSNNLNGLWYGLTPADSKTEGMINFGWFISRTETEENKHLPTFKKYIASEINAVKDFNNGNLTAKRLSDKYEKSDVYKIGEQLGHFKDIVGDFITPEVMKELTTEQILDKFNSEIEEALGKFIEKEATSLRDKFIDLGIEIEESTYVDILNKNKGEKELKEKVRGTEENPYFFLMGLPEGKSPGLSSNTSLNEFYKNYVVNYVFNIIEQHKLIWGDPRYWKDITKRTKSFNSGTYLSITEDWFDDFYNKHDNTKFIEDETGELIPIAISEGVLGFTNYDGKVRYNTYEDVVVISRQINQILEEILNSYSKKAFGKLFGELTESSQKEEAFEKTKISKEAWEKEKTNEDDASGKGTILSYREILRRSGNPKIFTDAKNELIEYDISLMRVEAEKKGKFSYPDNENGRLLKQYDEKLLAKGHPKLNGNTESINVSKPIQVGLLDTENMQPDLVKDSLFYLSWELVRNTPAEDFYLDMIKRNTAYIVPTSGHKIGEVNSAPMYVNGKINTEIVPHNVVSFDNLTIQVETEGSSKDVPQGSQLNKIGISNLFENTIPSDYKNTSKDFFSLTEEEKEKESLSYRLKKEHENALSWMTEKGEQEFFELFNIKKHNNKYTISEDSYPYIESLLQEELKSRNLPQNLRDSVRLVDGVFEISLDLIPQGEKFESILSSVLDKRVTSPSMNGFSAPQAPSTLLESNDRDFVIKRGDKWVQVDYSTLSKEDKGKAVMTSNDLGFVDGKMEVKLPFIFKELLKGVKDTEELTLKNLIDKGLIDEQLLKIIGFRIPTQELNSVENIIIKGFLPLSYGKCIVVPSEITTKAGSDYDIDKLNLYIYNYKQNPKTKKLEKITLSTDPSEKGIKTRYNTLIQSKLRDLIQPYRDLLRDSKVKSKVIRELEKDLEVFEELLVDSELDEYSILAAIIMKFPIKSLEEAMAADEKITTLQLELEGQNLTLENLFDEVEKIKKNIEDKNSYEEFSKLPIHLQNTKQALQNNYMDVLFKVLELPENRIHLFTPNSDKEHKDLSKQVSPEKAESSLTKYLSVVNNTETRHNFIVGKDGVAISASAQVSNNLFQYHSKYVLIPRIVNNINFPVNYEKVNSSDGQPLFKFNFGNTYDYNKEVISNKISGFINGFVDIAKDPFIIRMNANLQTAGIYLTGLRMGIPLKDLVFFFNQPIVLDYVKESILNKSVIRRVSTGSLQKTQLIEMVKSKYFPSEEPFTKTDFYTPEELLGFIRMNKEDRDEDFYKQQQNILKQFLFLEHIASELLVAQQGANFDRERINFLDSAYFAKLRYEKALKTYFKGFVESIKNNSYIGKVFNAKIYQRDAFSKLYLTGTPELNTYLEKEYRDIFNNTFGKDEALEKALDMKRSLINYLLNTTPIKINEDTYSSINSFVSGLFLSKNNLGRTLRDLQEKMQKGEIAENFFLQNMQTVFPEVKMKSRSNQNAVVNIKLTRKLADTVEIDLLTDGIRELLSNIETSSFVKNLIPYAIIQSGIKMNPVSFFEHLPNEEVIKITKQIEEFVKEGNLTEQLASFKDSYKKNSWKNTDIVPKIPFKTFRASYRGTVPNTNLRYLNIASARLSRNEFVQYTQTLPNIDKEEAKKRTLNKDYSHQTTTIYRRLDIPVNRIVNHPSFQLLTEENKEIYLTLDVDQPINKSTGKDGKEFISVIFYPDNKKGDGFWLSEHSVSKTKPSELYTPVDFPYTANSLFNEIYKDKPNEDIEFFHLSRLLESQIETPTQVVDKNEIQKQNVKGIEINSYQTGLGNSLTNVHYAKNGKSTFDIIPSDKSLKLTQAAKAKWGESVEAWYKSNNAQTKGIPEGIEGDKYDFNLMVGLITDKLTQYPNLVEQINQNGGLEFLQKSTHTMGNGRWSSKNPKNMFMNSLIQAYNNISQVVDNGIDAKTLKRGDIIEFQQQNFQIERVTEEGFDVRDVNTGDVDFISTEDYINETQEQPINKEIKPNELQKQNVFTIKPIQSADKKATIKASVANKYIGFAEGIEGSSTALYAKQISEQNNKFKIPISKTLNKFLEPFFNSNDESIVEPLAKNLTNEDKQILAKSIGRSYKDINQFDWYEAIWSDVGQEEVYYYLKTGNNLEQDIQKEKANSKLYNEWQNFIKENKDFVDGFYKLPKEVQKEQKKDFGKLKEKNDWYVFELSNLKYDIRKNLLKQEGYLENKINITSNIVNSGNYSSTDIIFISIGGKRGNPDIRKEQQDKTIKEALKAIESGATLITDNKSYVESSDYNEGEKRLAKNLEAKGYNYSEQTIDGQVLGVWNKNQPTEIKPKIDSSKNIEVAKERVKKAFSDMQKVQEIGVADTMEEVEKTNGKKIIVLDTNEFKNNKQKSVSFDRIFIPEQYRKQGLGLSIYIVRGEELLKEGKYLVNYDQLSDEAKQIWKRLIDLGLATDSGEYGTWQYTGIDNLTQEQPIVEETKENFNNLSEYTNEEKKKILTTFASKYNISEQQALEDINKALNENKQGTIDKLNECF